MHDHSVGILEGKPLSRGRPPLSQHIYNLLCLYTQHIRRQLWRMMITFANRSTADQWWRAVSEGPESKFYQRISPQFYTHDPNHGVNLNHFFTNARYQPISRPFRGKMFFTLLDDRGGRHLSVVPPQEITDHISGKWFYIRSKVHTVMYWCDGPDGVYLSDEHRKRTRFQLTGRNIPVDVTEG